MSRLAVCVCTHNPRRDFLAETLDALKRQVNTTQSWDLLIVDNASRSPLANAIDLSWHPRGRIVREDNLGIVHARLRALREATEGGYSLLLFVDDDNVLADDYIKQGLAIADHHPDLGCWGGQLLARYELPPPDWLSSYEKYLAVYPLDKPIISQRFTSYDGIPPSAGTFIRRDVWLRYMQLVESHPLRLTLGPKGDVRIGGEDMDIMLSAFDVNLGLARFPQLRLTHIMPKERMKPAYIQGLITSIFLGTGLLEYVRFGKLPQLPHRNWFSRTRYKWQISRLPEPWKGFYIAETRGYEEAIAMVAKWRTQSR